MIVENFGGNEVEIYRRFKERGRFAPDGLKYLSSWVDSEFKNCFQLMETDDENLISEWTGNWKDIVEFEIFPVITSAEASEKMAQKL